MKAVSDPFLQRLAGLEQSVLLVRTLRDFASIAAPAVRLRTAFSKAAITAHQPLRGFRDWEIIALDGGVLYLAALFESNTRDMAEALATATAKKYKVYGDVPSRVRSENLRLVGRLLADTNRSQVAHIDYSRVVTDLSRSLRLGRPVSLFSPGFAFHDRNMTSQTVSDIYGRCEVKDLWRTVGTAADLQSHLGSRSPETTAEVAKTKLDEFMELRNQIAHRGPSYSTVGDTVVLDYIEFFRSLVPSIGHALESHLAAIP